MLPSSISTPGVLAPLLRGRMLCFSGSLLVDACAPGGASLAATLEFSCGGGKLDARMVLDSAAIESLLASNTLVRLHDWLQRGEGGPVEAFMGQVRVGRVRGRSLFCRMTIVLDRFDSACSARVEGTVVENGAEHVVQMLEKAPSEVRCRPTDPEHDRLFVSHLIDVTCARAAVFVRSGASIHWSSGETGEGMLLANRGGATLFLRHAGLRAVEEFAGRVDAVAHGSMMQDVLRLLGAPAAGTVVAARVPEHSNMRGEALLALVWDTRIGDRSSVLAAVRRCLQRMVSSQQGRRLSDVFGVVLDAMSDGLCMVDARGEIVGMNRRGRELAAGSERDGGKLVGLSFARLLSARHASRFTRWIRQPVRVARRIGPLALRRPNGSNSPVLEVDMRAVGSFMSVLTLYDMTDQMLAKEREVQQRSMAMLGMVAAGMAHDFNNILGIVQNNIEAALDALPAPGPADMARSDLGHALTAVARGGGITRRVLTLSRRRAEGASLTNLGDLVDEWLAAIRHSLGPSYRLQWRLVGDVFVRLAPAELRSALLNLVINARDSMLERGVISVDVSLRDETHDGKRIAPGWALISVADEGPGFTDSALLRATDTGFTTKRGIGGQGIGLYSVSRFVENAKGELHLRNLPQGGACVDVYLPRARRPAVEARRVSVRAAVLAPCRILLVEDETPFAKPLARWLQQRGHSVTAVPSAEEALQVMSKEGPPDVLVADIGLDGMDGVELATVARARHPRLRILLVSGHVDVAADWPVLRKPFSPAALLEAIARVREPDSASLADGLPQAHALPAVDDPGSAGLDAAPSGAA